MSLTYDINDSAGILGDSHSLRSAGGAVGWGRLQHYQQMLCELGRASLRQRLTMLGSEQVAGPE